MFFTRGLISGYFFFSSVVGFLASPVGGPKTAQVFRSLASAVVVAKNASQLKRKAT